MKKNFFILTTCFFISSCNQPEYTYDIVDVHTGTFIGQLQEKYDEEKIAKGFFGYEWYTNQVFDSTGKKIGAVTYSKHYNYLFCTNELGLFKTSTGTVERLNVRVVKIDPK
jgi:hypothetical protein